MKIIIAADLAPTNLNESLFINGKSEVLIDEDLYMKWFSSDIRIFNLETPITNNPKPILKNGPNLIAKEKTVNGIVKLKPSLVCLANNHIMDQDYEGLKNTISLLDKHKLPHIGASNNLFNAKQPYIYDDGEKKIGIYNCAEHEFGIAEENIPGANPFDPLTSLDDIQELSKQVDYTIVIYHGGKEYYRYPSPYLQKVCRRMVDKGADFVVTQHSHCIGAKEVYNGKTIVYGQGNFLFNYEHKLDDEFWNNGMLIEIDLADNSPIINYIPYLSTKEGVRLANDIESKHILKGFDERSEQIKKPGFIDNEYTKFAQKHIHNYLVSLSGQSKWIRRIDRRVFKGKLTKWYFSKKKLLSIYNFIECEAHRELLVFGTKLNIYENKN